jgi:uncharacterized membrane protein YidH (DUF202 family)
MLELIQEIVVYSTVIIATLGLAVWWDQVWHETKYDLSRKNIIANVGIIIIIVTGFMVAKGFDS